MTGSAGDALELALALLRMPAQRQVLRERPLPADIDGILPIAAGSREALAEAAQATGESKALILEAVRFYLQEVLFFPDADAYRILAVAPDAAVERIQQNHRQLQRWLHPDRRGGDLESGFASRVNQAWNTLRTDERRQAYDAILQQQPAPTVEGLATTQTAPMGWHRIDGGTQRPRWRQALPLAVLVTACGLFALLLLVRPSDEAAPGEWRVGAGRDGAARDGAARDGAARDGAALAVAPAVEPVTAGTDLPEAQAIAEQAPLPRVPVRDPRHGLLPTRAMPLEREQTAKVAMAKPTASPPSIVELIPMAATPENEQPPEPLEQGTHSAIAAEAIPSRATQVNKMPEAAAVMPPKPEASPPVEKPIQVASAMPARVVATPAVSATRTSRRSRVPTQHPMSTEIPPAVATTTQSTEPPPSLNSANPSPANDTALVEQVRLARLRATEVTRFLSDPQARTPPVWNDPDIQAHAEGLRRTWQAGGERKRIALLQPDWRISSSAARLQAVYRCSSRCNDGEHGVLHMQMAWRNGMWLVRELEMDRSP